MLLLSSTFQTDSFELTFDLWAYTPLDIIKLRKTHQNSEDYYYSYYK